MSPTLTLSLTPTITPERWAHILSPCPFFDIAAGHDGTVWAIDGEKKTRLFVVYGELNLKHLILENVSLGGLRSPYT